VALSIHQLMVMRSLLAQGWPSSMVDILLRRCALEEEGWQELLALGWLEEKEGRWFLTKAGKRGYKRESKGRYF